MGAIDKPRNQGAAICFQASSRVARLLAPTYRPVISDAGFDTVESWECPAIIGSDLIPTLRSDLQALERFLASGCSHDAAKVCLGQLAALTKSRGDMTAQAVTIKVNAMASMLAEYPQLLVEKACRAYALESIFFPSLAEIVAHIKPEMVRYEAQHMAIKTMLAKAETDIAQSAKTRAAESPDDRSRALELSGAMRRKLTGHASPEDLALIECARRKYAKPSPGPGGNAA